MNAHGALIILRQAVAVGQELKLKHLSTGEEQICRVVDVNTGPEGEKEVGVQFVHPAPHFWHVAFPPVDWNARNPEAKRFTAPNLAEKK